MYLPSWNNNHNIPNIHDLKKVHMQVHVHVNDYE